MLYIRANVSNSKYAGMVWRWKSLLRGWAWMELIFARTSGDGIETGRAGMQMKSAGMGGDGCNFHSRAGL